MVVTISAVLKVDVESIEVIGRPPYLRKLALCWWGPTQGVPLWCLDSGLSIRINQENPARDAAFPLLEVSGIAGLQHRARHAAPNLAEALPY